jgi:hypothetical protein
LQALSLLFVLFALSCEFEHDCIEIRPMFFLQHLQVAFELLSLLAAEIPQFGGFCLEPLRISVAFGLSQFVLLPLGLELTLPAGPFEGVVFLQQVEAVVEFLDLCVLGSDDGLQLTAFVVLELLQFDPTATLPFCLLVRYLCLLLQPLLLLA